MKLVIVESPTKAKTISRFLDPEFMVMSSFGHVRDLPQKKIGVDTKNGFTPTYVSIPRAEKHIRDLKQSAEKADVLILATDEDREGEAIAWHIVQALVLNETKNKNQKKTIERIVFHEITKRAIEGALATPRAINMNLVNAQQARRILDRLVGYKLSPFLWRKVAKGLSAGRVQSAAVRLIVEREGEIEAFIPKEYWTVEAILQKNTGPETQGNNAAQTEFMANLVRIGNTPMDKFEIKTKERAEEIVMDLEGANYHVLHIERKETMRSPLPPYTTSTLQQDAWRRLRFSAKLTMRTAQQLYEGMDLGKGPVGLITYMRTDSQSLSEESRENAKSFIEHEYGKTYGEHRQFKTKSRLAQEAHEAIRPTSSARTPDSVKPYLDLKQFKLYTLIWQRFVASQMAAARFDSTTVDIETVTKASGAFGFRATGQIRTFDGFLKVYPLKFEERELPELTENEALRLKDLVPGQHFTKPPARYSEATLVKKLEEEGIGRPSTYAPIMSTIQERGYVEKNEKKYLRPTQTGTIVNNLLVKHFPNVVDIGFTAHMEEDLDGIAEGKKEWVPVLESFYEPFAKNLKEKLKEVSKKEVVPDEPTNETCEKCGKPLVIKLGRFGKFLACSGFPECKNTKNIVKTTGVACPKCKTGEVIEKRSKRGKIFFGCTSYPNCDFALWNKPTGETCPECQSLLVEYRGRTRCSNKECGWQSIPPKSSNSGSPLDT